MAGLSSKSPGMTWNGSRWVPDQNARPITGYQGQEPVYGESPVQAQTRQQQEQRNATETASRQTQAMANHQLEQARLETNAMKQATAQSWMMAGNGNIPRSVTGTTMTIGDGGGGGGTRRTGGGDFTFEQIMTMINKLGGAGNQSPIVDLEEPPQSRTDPSLAFSRAKDVAGRSANKAIEALKDVMSSRGLGSSGYESAGGAQILGDTARYITDADYQAAMADDNRNWDAKKTRYSGGITQRGQTMQAQQAMLGLLPTILNYSRSY